MNVKSKYFTFSILRNKFVIYFSNLPYEFFYFSEICIVEIHTSFLLFQEKALLGGIMLGSMLIIPAWVLLNLKNYKSK